MMSNCINMKRRFRAVFEIRAKSLRSRIQPHMEKIMKPKAHWLKSDLLVDLEYRALTGARLLRHPPFEDVREDLKWEQACPAQSTV
jgi:hypothetical protein